MPLPFEQFQGKGVLGFSSSISTLCSDSSLQDKIWASHEKIGKDFCYVAGGCGFPEPTSVLDTVRSPSPLASSSTITVSSSHGGASGSAAACADVTAVLYGLDEKCGQMGLEDLGGLLSGSPGQEQSILRLIMGDVEDPASGFGVFNPGFGFVSGPVSDNPNPLFSGGLPLQAAFHGQPIDSFAEKLQIPNPEVPITETPAILISPIPNPPSCPPAKRLNSGQTGSRSDFHQHQKVFPFSDPGHDPFLGRGPPVVALPRMAGDGQSAVIDQLFNAAELIGTGGDLVLAQGILARLNHHLNTVGNRPPFQRAAFYITEALQSLVLSNSVFSAQTLVLRIAAYRSFLETSPFLQFANFTANQAILESFEGSDRIHIIDFDVGNGGQWASMMQELAARNRGTPPLRITAFASPSTTSDEFELRFTEENLKSFAEEIKLPFEMEFSSLELLLNPAYWPLSIRSSEKEAIAVNLPVSSVISGYLPLILRFLKQISPNVVVCSDRGCDRDDAPFPNAVIHALQYCTSLLESLDAANANADAANANADADALAKIERFWVEPSMEKLLMNRHRWPGRSPPWRSLFTQCGFWPASMSNKAEAQAECLVRRSSASGFHVEKRQSSSSLALCWQRKELVAVSAWRC